MEGGQHLVAAHEIEDVHLSHDPLEPLPDLVEPEGARSGYEPALPIQGTETPVAEPAVLTVLVGTEAALEEALLQEALQVPADRKGRGSPPRS